MRAKTYFRTVDVVLTGVFCGLWTALNLTLGPLSFSLLGLPILHDFGVFFTLLLVVWVTGRFGTSSLAGAIGSILAILLGGPFLIVCFAASAFIFDVLMFLDHHEINVGAYSLFTAAIATILSAYVAGVLIGVFFTSNQTLQWALTVWGGWHLIGGVLTVAVTFPIIMALEKANVRTVLDGRR
jgi:hypothetical protein